MTTGEKLYNQLKKHFIEKYGDEFLELSDKDQHNLILALVWEYMDSKKSNK